MLVEGEGSKACSSASGLVHPQHSPQLTHFLVKKKKKSKIEGSGLRWDYSRCKQAGMTARGLLGHQSTAPSPVPAAHRWELTQRAGCGERRAKGREGATRGEAVRGPRRPRLRPSTEDTVRGWMHHARPEGCK